MCLVEKVMKFRGKGDNRQVQLKWTKGGYSWETFVPPYENLRKEVGEPVNVFGSLYDPYSNQRYTVEEALELEKKCKQFG